MFWSNWPSSDVQAVVMKESAAHTLNQRKINKPAKA
jgi:hypothetical protein